MKKPSTNITYEIYLDGTRLIGSAECEFPNIEPITATIKGSGIGGETEVPVLGHLSNMTTKITWINTTPDVRLLMAQKYHHLEFWAATQEIDSATGAFVPVQQKIIQRACPAGTTVGKFGIGEVQGTENNFNVSYFRWFYNNQEICEIDVYNQTYKVNGEDLLSAVRRLVGL